jgi:glycosyltransferase involved in cell wall biosynthesis
MSRQPRRVVHVVRAMDRAGVETWLMHVLRTLDPRVLQMDFLVHTDNLSAYDQEIIGRGSRLIRCTVSHRSAAYGIAVRSLLRQFGPYDAIHSHVQHFSGYLLGLTRGLDIPVRIAHSHCDYSNRDSTAGWLRRRYIQLSRSGFDRYATNWLAASQIAGRALFGAKWGVDPRSQVMHCAIDLQPFRRLEAREEVRTSLGIVADEVVIGHVGRFETQKNHSFLVEVAAEASRRVPRLRLLLVGEGPDRPLVQDRVRALGMTLRTMFLGSRADVPRLLSAMDGFLFPSRWEGLGLAVIEAQAAGLPCLISDCVPAEADVAPELVDRLPLATGAPAWADALAAVIGRRHARQAGALASVANSDFNIERSMEGLYALYHA